MNFLTRFDGKQSDFSAAFKTHKVVVVSPPEVDDLEKYYFDLASGVGIPLIYEENPITGQIVANQWTQIKFEADAAKNSYKSSNSYQPLHTDYGYFAFEVYASFFYCLSQASFGGATTFVDVDTIVEVLQATDSSLLSAIQKTLIKFGRGDNPLAHNDDYILSKDALGWKINWNYYRATQMGQHPLVEEFRDFLDARIEKSGELTEARLEEGQAVYFHDRRVLHGRNSFVGTRHLNKGGISTSLPAEVSALMT